MFTKKIPPMPSGFEDYGDEKDWREMCISERRFDRLQRWKALKSLFNRKNIDADFSYIWPYMIAGFFALVLGRAYKHNKDGSDDHKYEDVSSWDYAQLYAGWEVYCLRVSLKKIRYEIFKDGDWTM